MSDERFSRKFGWKWIEGTVDTSEDHFKITFGKVEDELTPAALIGRGEDRTLLVQFLPLDEAQGKAKILEQVKSELDFYLVERRVGEPWIMLSITAAPHQVFTHRFTGATNRKVGRRMLNR